MRLCRQTDYGLSIMVAWEWSDDIGLIGFSKMGTVIQRRS
jgi:hypothetical protein